MSDTSREVITFANGARLVLDPMPGLKTASVGVWVGAGARHESAAENGLAHFLEHMAFKGAGGMGALELAERVENRGAVMNASTDYERTGYFVRCLTEDAPDMLAVAASLALAADLPEDEIAREKGVVLQEIGEAADQPDDLVFELAQAGAWAGHALGRPILGTADTLKAIDRDMLADFVGRHYRGSSVVMSVAGAYDRTAIVDLASARLSVLSAGAAEAVLPPAHQRGAFTGRRKLEQTHLVLSQPGPGAVSPDRFAARLFTEIFGGGMASRLFQEVREKRGLAYAIDAYCDQYADTARFNVYCGCDPADAVDVQAIVRDIWGELAAKGPTEDEVARAKAVVRTQFAMSSEAPSARAGSGAYELLQFDTLIPLADTLQSIERVKADDIRLIAAQALAGGSTAASVGPAAGLKAAEKYAANSA